MRGRRITKPRDQRINDLFAAISRSGFTRMEVIELVRAKQNEIPSGWPSHSTLSRQCFNIDCINCDNTNTDGEECTHYCHITANPPPLIGTYMGTAEVAEYLGVSKQSISNWRKRKGFVEPYAELAAGPVWLGKDIEEWRKKNTEG